jgi:hypothetical protein
VAGRSAADISNRLPASVRLSKEYSLKTSIIKSGITAEGNAVAKGHDPVILERP